MTDQEKMLKIAIHLQCALNNLDTIKNKSKYSRNLQKNIERFDRYMTTERKLISKLYQIDEEFMLTLETALDEKVGRLSDIEFHEFINIEE